MNADKTSKLIAESRLNIDDKLSMHLEGNHYPPIDKRFIPVAKQAIELAQQGDWDTLLSYPNGIQRTVAFTVEGMNLKYFLEEDE